MKHARMQCRTLFLSCIVLFVLASLPLISSVGASSETWNQTYGGPDNDSAGALIQTSDGGYALAGFTQSFGAGETEVWLVKTDSSGNMQWNQAYGGQDFDSAWAIVQTVDGGYALAGSTGSFGAGESDAWLIKTDEYGVVPEFPDTTPHTSEPFPTWVVVAIVIPVVVGAALLVYFRKIRKTTGKTEIISEGVK